MSPTDLCLLHEILVDFVKQLTPKLVVACGVQESNHKRENFAYA